MGFIDNVKKLFADNKEGASEPDTGEVGFYQPLLLNYNRNDFTRYNPDQLIANKGAGIYKKMMRDDQIKAVAEFKQSAILSRGFYFDVKNDDEGKPDPEQEKIAEYFTFMLDSIEGSFRDSLKFILSGINTGFSISEKVYAPIVHEGTTRWGLKSIKPRPFDSFRFKTDRHGNIQSLEQTQGVNFIKVPMDKIIHFVHNPVSDLQYGESDLRACYRNWWSKDIAIKFWNIHLERHATGFTYAKLAGNLSDPERTNLQNMLKNMGAITSGIIPNTVELNNLTPTTTDAYEQAINMHDAGIARSLLVPNLLGLGGAKQTGSYSQSSTQLEVFFWILAEIAGRLAEALNDQLFTDLAKWNFNTTDFPRFKFEPLSDFMKSEISKTWGELISKGAVQRSDTDEAHIRRMLEFPDKDEATAQENQPPAVKPEPDARPDDGSKDKKKEFSEQSTWLKRVNFAEVGRVWDKLDNAFITDMADLMADVRTDMVKQIRKLMGVRSAGNIKVKELEQIIIKTKHATALRKLARGHLLNTLRVAYAGAQKELPQKFGELITAGMDMIQADKYLASKSFKITGVLDEVVLRDVQNVLTNGIKYDWAQGQMMHAIENHTGLLSVLPKTDSAGRAINVPHRLENIVRTNNADAWSTGRQAFHSTPDMRKFIEAFEYSAILDQRTTEICASLDGKVRKDWANYAPPNHYQCRSMLIPVTVVDEWSGQDDALPQHTKPLDGFGGEIVTPPKPKPAPKPLPPKPKPPVEDITPKVKVEYFNISEADKKRSAKTMAMLADKTKKLLQERNVKVKFADDISLITGDPTSAKKCAYYQFGDINGEVHIGKRYIPEGHTGLRSHDIEWEAHLHEIGHVVDDMVGRFVLSPDITTYDRGWRINGNHKHAYSYRSRTFQAAYNADFEDMIGNSDKLNHYSYFWGDGGGQYDRRLEAFAESFAYIILKRNGMTTQFGSKWGRDWKKVVKHMEEVLGDWI